jgi:iron complex transport system substrate-binding protein
MADYPRIISLLPSATEIVCALGLREHLVGVTHECDFPSGIDVLPRLTASRISHEKMTSAEIDHAVRSQLDGHGSIYDLDEKALADLKPDLIITQELCEVCAVSYTIVMKAAKSYLADAHVVSLEPNTIEDIFENIKTVGELAGVSDEADEVVIDLKARMDALRAKTKDLNDRPKIFMLEWLEPPFSPGHWVPEQVEAAGGICLMSDAGQKSRTITFQEIIESEPEVMVLIPCGYYTQDIIRQLPNTAFPDALKETPAFKNGEVWALDATSYFSRPGPRVVDGAEILAKIVHPAIFGLPTANEAVRIARDLLQFKKAA